MGKSFKKNPIAKNNVKNRRHMKRLANKKVRREAEIKSGKSYRKHFNTYDIYDYRVRCPHYKHALDWYPTNTEEEVYQFWARDFLRK